MESGGDEREEDAQRVAGGEEVDEEEIVGRVVKGCRADEEKDGCPLRLFKLSGWIGNSPAVPVLENGGLVVAE